MSDENETTQDIKVINSLKMTLPMINKGTEYIEKENVIGKKSISKTNIELAKINKINFSKENFIFFFCHGQNYNENYYDFSPISYEKALQIFGNENYNNIITCKSKDSDASLTNRENNYLNKYNCFNKLNYANMTIYNDDSNDSNSSSFNIINTILQCYEKPFSDYFKDPNYYGGIGPQDETVEIDSTTEIKNMWCPFQYVRLLKKLNSIKNVLQIKSTVASDDCIDLSSLPVTVELKIVFKTNSQYSDKDEKYVTVNVPNFVLTIPICIDEN